jgi:hypothetical protein
MPSGKEVIVLGHRSFDAVAVGRNDIEVVILRNVGGGKQNADRLAVDVSLLAARKAAEIQADIDKRFRAQAAFPGSDDAVRILIEELRVGKPDYGSGAFGVYIGDPTNLQ